MLVPGALLACPKCAFLCGTAREKINPSPLQVREECVQSARQEPLGALLGPGKDQQSPAQHHTETAFVPAAISTFLQSPGRERRERHCLSQPPALCSHPDTQAGGEDDGQHPKSRLGVMPLPGKQLGMQEGHSSKAWGRTTAELGRERWHGAP